MNYLSHYFLENSPGDPYLTMGLVLPDLAGAAQRGWKPAKKFLHQSEPEQLLLKGIDRHLQADRLFHNSAFFKENTVALRQLLLSHGSLPQESRLFFAAHILLEMLLDRLLLTEEKEMPYRFYDTLDKVEYGHIDNFLDRSLTNTTRFKLFFDRFREHRFLLNYTEDESFYFSLRRIFERARQPALDEKMPASFTGLITEAEMLLRKNYAEFFESLRADLNRSRP